MRKLEALKVGGVQREEIRKKRVLEVEKLIFLHFFLHYSFSFTLQRWFLELEVALS
jgi:hypothetical protein